MGKRPTDNIKFGGDRDGEAVTVAFLLEPGPSPPLVRLEIDDKPLLFVNDRASIEGRRGQRIRLTCALFGAPGSFVTVRCTVDGIPRKVFDRLTILSAHGSHMASIEIEL